ncbi:MAG: TatD family hydrolase [Patescibacteria group bacterium]
MTRPKYIDIHAHVNFGAYDTDRTEVLKRAHEAGVWMINVGTHLETSRQVVELAEKADEGVYAIIGLHPIHTSPLSVARVDPNESEKPAKVYETGEVFDKNAYRELLKNPRVVGIGECGLDLFRLPEHADLAAGAIQRQKKAFREQIELAIEFDKPIMIHARESYKEILEIIDEYLSTSKGRLRGNAHFFAGTKEEANAFLERGFTLSFTGVVTFAKQYRELVEMVPLDRIMVETDCPYVTPVPFRGTRNEPLYVREIAAKIADIKKIDIEIVKKALVDNAFSMFRLK